MTELVSLGNSKPRGTGKSDEITQHQTQQPTFIGALAAKENRGASGCSCHSARARWGAGGGALNPNHRFATHNPLFKIPILALPGLGTAPSPTHPSGSKFKMENCI